VSVMDVRTAEERGDVTVLCELLAATKPITRVSAAFALGDLGDAAAVGPLLRCLQANDDLVRNAALTALGKIGDHSAVPTLIEVAKTDEASGVRTTAIDALATLGEPRGIEMLTDLATDPAPLLASATRTFRTPVTNRRQVRIDARRVRGWALKRLRELHAVEALDRLEASPRPRSLRLRFRYMQTLRALRA
jgi:HEAT repeat protein